MVLAACAQTATAVADGQLYCARATAAGPLVVALADAAGLPFVVTGRAAADVAAACALVGAIPVVPPANPNAAPVVAVKL
jgi:predicted ATPase